MLPSKRLSNSPEFETSVNRVVSFILKFVLKYCIHCYNRLGEITLPPKMAAREKLIHFYY